MKKKEVTKIKESIIKDFNSPNDTKKQTKKIFTEEFFEEYDLIYKYDKILTEQIIKVIDNSIKYSTDEKSKLIQKLKINTYYQQVRELITEYIDRHSFGIKKKVRLMEEQEKNKKTVEDINKKLKDLDNTKKETDKTEIDKLKAIDKIIEKNNHDMLNLEQPKYKKAIDIINEEIANLELIFYNHNIMEYFTKHKSTKYPDERSEIHFILKDLYKIKTYLKGKQGTKSVKDMQKEIEFDILNFDYVKKLYFMPKIDLENGIKKIFSETILTKDQETNIHKAISDFFNSQKFIKYNNRYTGYFIS